MEPCAPGTEDEPPIMYSTLNKKENEQQRLLKQKAYLRNGKYENVFELSYQNGSEHWYCRACECPVMGRVFQHEAGRRHTQNISNTINIREDVRRGPSPEEPAPLEVAPGEPMPPGFEEVARVSQIQERLDGFKVGPLIALEYLLELQDDDTTKEPVYLCILCDKKGDPRTVLTHLASYNHISQYLQKHFPTAWRALAPYNTKQYRRNWQTTLQKIAEGIEKKFGRLKPHPIEKDKFEKDRMHYLQLVGKGRHFSENTGYTFEELVVHDELTKSHEDDKAYEATTINNWGNASTIQKPFKKRSPSPPVLGVPSKRNKGNAQTNPRKAQAQEPAFTVQDPKNQASKPQSQAPPMRQVPPQQQHPQGKGPPPRQQPAFNRQQPAFNRQPPVRRRSLSSVSSLSDDGADNDRRRKERERPRGRPQYDRDHRSFAYGRRRSPSPRRRSPLRRRSPSPRRRSSPKNRSISPHTVKRRSPSPSAAAEQEKEKLRKIEEFRKLARAIETDLTKTLKLHEKNPEKHPQYNEEWKKYWNRRYKELKAEGVDVQKYDFKPGWIEFWNKRMVEIHSDELRNRKEALRKRLALPDEISPIKFKIGGGVALPEKIGGTKPLPMAAQPDQDNEVIIIEDKDDDKVRKAPNSRDDLSKRVVSKRDRSPVGKGRTRNSPQSSVDARLKFKPRSRSKSRERAKLRERSRSREKHYGRSHSRERKVRNASPISETSRSSRPLKRSSSRERFAGRRTRSRSRSRERTSANGSESGDRAVASRVRNRSPMSVNSSISRSKGFRSRDRSLSRNRSHSRGRSPFTKKMKDKRSRSISRERSWEKRDDRKRPVDFIRESSFERDLRGRERIRTVADLPWEKRERDPPQIYRNPYLPPPIMRDVTRKPVDMAPPTFLDDDDDESQVNVVDVLRLLTALEERMGSLGPKVIDLLAQALALEKKEANSSESLLDNDINCVLFETVKEKLKGQLFAGLVDLLEERAYKRAIKKIASLMHMAGQRKRQREKLLPKSNPVSLPGSGAVDKSVIAKQIANALIAQGKTDVTQAELETLINTVVGMAEASKNSNKPITTATFLQALGADGSESQDKIIIPTSSKRLDLIDLDKLTEPLTPSPGKNSISNMENLSDSDLQTLLQNFKDLSTEEQHNLINYLKKLEYQEPERVETLRKFVNLESGSKPKEEEMEEEKENAEENDQQQPKTKSGRESPFSARMGGVNPGSNLVDIESDEDHNDDKNDKDDKETEKTQKKLHVDSEEDEYTFEDVVKTVSKNVKDKEIEHSKKVLEESMKYDKSKSESNLSNAKDLISNLMANITKSNSKSNTIDLLGLGGKSLPSNPTTSVAGVDFTKLSGINVASLTSIVNNVKSLTFPPDIVDKKLDFEPPSGKNANKLNFDLAQLNPEKQEQLPPADSSASGSFSKGGPLTLNLLERTENAILGRSSNLDLGPKRPFETPRDNPGFDRFGPGGPDRFNPGSLDRLNPRGQDRFGPGGLDRFGPDRFGPGGPDRFGPAGPDRFAPAGADRFAPGGPDRIAPGRLDRFASGGPDRFANGGPDRFAAEVSDRFGSGGPDRFGPGGPDRFGPGDPDRLGPGGSDRMGPGGPDRFGPGGPDRFGPGGPDRLGSGGPDRLGPGGPDRLGPGGPDRLGPSGPDRFPSGGADRFGIGGPDRFTLGGSGRFGSGGSDRFGPDGPDRFGQSGSDRFGSGGADNFDIVRPDRNFGRASDSTRGFDGPDTGFGKKLISGPDKGMGGLDRGFGGPDRGTGLGGGGLGLDRLGGAGAGPFRGGLNPLTDLNASGKFGNRASSFGNDLVPRGGGLQRPGPNEQRPFPRLPAPDFNRGNFNRW